MTAAEVARKAADLLKRDGWCQGRSEGPNGERCLVAALSVAGWRSTRMAWRRVFEAIRQEAGAPSLTDWNDTPGRTADEVIALLRQVATELEAS